jgi:type IV pilus assembly protein PilW
MLKNNQGFTMIELLIAMVIGIILLWGVTTTFVGSVQTSAAAVRQAQFDQEMRSTMSIITRDLKRAGYSKNATDDIGTGTNTNAFITTVSGTTSEPLQIWDSISANVPISMYATPAPGYTSAGQGKCVTFAYDQNQATPAGDGALDVGSADFRGFRQNGTKVQMRTSGGTAGSITASCNEGGDVWSDMTTAAVNVTQLSFSWVDYTDTNDPTSTPTVVPTPAVVSTYSRDHSAITQRVIRVVFSATSTGDPNLSRTLIEDVKVRNYVYDPNGR